MRFNYSLTYWIPSNLVNSFDEMNTNTTIPNNLIHEFLITV
jgi:hypothetical protein